MVDSALAVVVNALKDEDAKIRLRAATLVLQGAGMPQLPNPLEQRLDWIEARFDEMEQHDESTDSAT